MEMDIFLPSVLYIEFKSGKKIEKESEVKLNSKFIPI